MGMYDTVMVRCPKCGRMHDFQTKSGECVLMVYDLVTCPDDVLIDVNRHAPYECDCGSIIEVDIESRKVVMTNKTKAAIEESAKLPTAERMEDNLDWKLTGHSYQIADTGDYDGHYEITNGKISILTQDDDDESLQPIVDALNNSGCKFYQNDWFEFENKMLKDENAELRERVKELEGICEYALKAIKAVNSPFGATKPIIERIEKALKK